MLQSIRCISLVGGWLLLTAAAQGSHHHPAPETRYTRSAGSFSVPAVELVDAAGKTVSLPALLATEDPVAVQFIFTTCPTVCPVLTGTFAAALGRLGEEAERLRLLSITIDPEYDTPEQLRAYGERYGADPRWLFLTGRLEDIISVQKAFDTYRGNKMRHEPVTLLRATPAAPWIRLEGFPSAEQLAEEIHGLLD